MDLDFAFVKTPQLGAQPASTDLASLAALLGQSELANAASPLAMAIAQFEQHVQQQLQVSNWSFFRDLLPSIFTWASQEPYASARVPLLTRGRPGKVVLPRAHIRCLIANSFLLNITCPDRFNLPLPPPPDDEDTFGKHTWRRVFSRTDCDLSTHKIMCLLAYFYDAQQRATGQQGSGEEDASDPGVVIERLCAATAAMAATAAGLVEAGQTQGPPDAGADPLQRWTSSSAPIRASMVRIHSDSMESSDARAFVDFANRYVGYRAIIPSMTQEEVLWCVVPEVQPASFLCECMADDEAVIIRNVHRVSKYSGYLHTFKWEGLWTPPAPPPSPVSPSPAIQPSADDAQGHAPLQVPNAAGLLAAAEAQGKGTGATGVAVRRQHDVLVMDALVARGVGYQFTPEALARDLTKAWLCYDACGVQASANGGSGPDEASQQRGCDPNAISSGNWGCGVFGGHRILKFLQQLCAAAEANARRPSDAQIRLDFSTFGDAVLLERLQRLVDGLETSADASQSDGSTRYADASMLTGAGGARGASGAEDAGADVGVVTVGHVVAALDEFGRKVVRRNNANAEKDEEVLLERLLGKLSGQRTGFTALGTSCVIS